MGLLALRRLLWKARLGATAGESFPEPSEHAAQGRGGSFFLLSQGRESPGHFSWSPAQEWRGFPCMTNLHWEQLYKISVPQTSISGSECHVSRGALNSFYLI